ncbi:hypothetical protein [Diplocloster hominis]
MSEMAFWAEFVKTVLSMVFIAAVAFGGIRFGKFLRDRKNAKLAGK